MDMGRFCQGFKAFDQEGPEVAVKKISETNSTD